MNKKEIKQRIANLREEKIADLEFIQEVRRDVSKYDKKIDYLVKELRKLETKYYLGKLFKDSKYPSNIYCLVKKNHHIFIYNITCATFWNTSINAINVRTDFNVSRGSYITEEDFSKLLGTNKNRLETMKQI